MALVLLPCDLPSWPTVQHHLAKIKLAKNVSQLVDGMQKLHSICSISLDPEDSGSNDKEAFLGLKTFMDHVLTDEERDCFFGTCLPSLVAQALQIEQRRPYHGWRYSLQQQADCAEGERGFVASLLANAFFSTFPKRTRKTHPTLQDCNFCRSFAHLQSSLQQRKLYGVFCYFNWLAKQAPKGKVVFSRHVIPKKDLSYLDEWLQSDDPLCPVVVRHERKPEGTESGTCQVCFSSSRIGGDVLDGGEKQEDEIFCTYPELFVAMVSTESLESNEALVVHGLQPIVTREDCHLLLKDQTTSPAEGLSNSEVCFLDAADFSVDQSSQYLAENVLRELNKAFVGFRQRCVRVARLPPVGKSCSSTPSDGRSPVRDDFTISSVVLPKTRGEPPVADPTVDDKVHKQSSDKSVVFEDVIGRQECRTSMGEEHQMSLAKEHQTSLAEECRTSVAEECRTSVAEECRTSVAEECRTSVTEEGESAGDARSKRSRNSSADDASDDSVYGDCVENCTVWEDLREQRPSNQPSISRPLTMSLERQSCPPPQTLEGISMEASFVTCYSSQWSSKDSLEVEPEDQDEDDQGNGDDEFSSCSEDQKDTDVKDSEEVPVVSRPPMSAISKECKELWDRRLLLVDRKNRIPVGAISETDTEGNSSFGAGIYAGIGRLPNRAPSTGFVLEDDDEEDPFSGDGLEHERVWMAHFRHRSANPSRSASGRNSSRYSFSSDFSSDLDELYEHFEEMMTQGPIREDPTYVGRKLKRALSDSLTSFPRAIHEFPRSLSLTEKMQQEKLSLECAKRKVPPQAGECAVFRERSQEGSGKEPDAGLGFVDYVCADPLQMAGYPEYFRPGERHRELANPIVTGNWGCGGKCGDPRLKALIQWMAASRASVPLVIYYSFGDPKVVKLNIVCRVLLDRRWSVGNLARAVLQRCEALAKIDCRSAEEEVDLLDFLLPKETDL